MTRIKKPAGRSAGFVSSKRMRTHLGVSERTWARWIDEGMPVAERGRGGRPSMSDPLAVAKWIHTREELLVGGATTSPALEEYRRQKARQAKRDNDVAEGELLDAGETVQDIKAIFEALRSEFVAVGRVHGAVVEVAIREAVNRAEASCRARFPERFPVEEASHDAK